MATMAEMTTDERIEKELAKLAHHFGLNHERAEMLATAASDWLHAAGLVVGGDPELVDDDVKAAVFGCTADVD